MSVEAPFLDNPIYEHATVIDEQRISTFTDVVGSNSDVFRGQGGKKKKRPT